MTRWQTILFTVAGLLLLAGFLLFIVPWWVYHPLGECTGANCGYQFWSGIAGSFLIGGGLWSGALGMYWHHQCGAPGCLRVGKHPTADGLHRLCARHHPDLPDDRRASLAEIHEHHRRHRRMRS